MISHSSQFTPGRAGRVPPLALTAPALATALGVALALVPLAPAKALATEASTGAMPLPAVAVETSPGLTEPLSHTTVSGEAVATGRLSSGDSALLLRSIPGVSLYSAGGVSALPAIHGMVSDRVQTRVNGRPITSSCPNHMNSPLSYLPAADVATVAVLAGITPVSAGGDSIAGTIAIDSAAPRFAEPGKGVLLGGQLASFFRSNGNGLTEAAQVTVAGEQASLGYNGSWSKAGNYTAGGSGPKVLSSLYQTTDHAMTLALRRDNHLLQTEVGVQYMPYQGYPNQRMDLTHNLSTHVNARYQGDYDWGRVDGRVFWQNVQHKMNFLNDKGGTPAGGMPMATDGTDFGYSLKAEFPLSEIHTLRLGNEAHLYRLDDWWDPISAVPNGMMSPNRFINISNGQRDQFGTFAEWEAKWTSQWTTLFGVRSDVVNTDAGTVQGYSNNAMAGYLADSRAFNARGRDKTDINFDLTALVRWEPNLNSTYEAGYARKSRSPNLYERYSWSTGQMASTMIGWFGDANGYVGNPDLKPEVAHTVSVTFGFHDQARKDWDVKVTPYYTYVEDYITARRIASFAGAVPRLDAAAATFNQFQFVNREAEFYGLDLSGRVGLWDSTAWGRGEFSGTLSWVHGEVLNSSASVGRNVYQVMPANTKLALGHLLGGWRSALELEVVADKDSVDGLRNEPKTPAYALVNARTGYTWENVRVDFGIENLMDTRYYLPLGGVAWGNYRGGGSVGPVMPVPGPGRSFNVGMTIKF